MKRVLILGGGLTGMKLALEQASAGNKVYLVENAPAVSAEGINIDGNLAFEAPSSLPSLEELEKNDNIQVITNADLTQVRAENGEFKLRVKKRATRVIDKGDNDWRDCIRVCPASLWDDYNKGLSLRTAIDSFPTEPRKYHIIKETPICEELCPLHLNVRGYVGLIADGKFDESLALIRKLLPFPATIGRICPRPCEQGCNRGRVDDPIDIRGLKRFVADYEISGVKGQEPPTIRQAKGEKRVATIGAGPAGLTAAYNLAQLGYGVTVFESLPVAGGMLYVGIPEYRLPKKILEREIDLIKEAGVDIKTNTPIGKGLTIDDLFQQGYEAVFIAVGAHKSQRLDIPGEDRDGVVPGVDFLRDLNLGNEVRMGKRVAVIGGGNVAIDAARASLRLGAKKVSILYRRSRQEIPASDEEIEAALAEGVEIEYLVAPREVLCNGGRVSGLRCVRMELGELDASGRRRPVPIEGSEFDLQLDMVIPAIGQVPDLSWVGDNGGIKIKTTERGTLLADPDTLATGITGAFAGGDAVTGPGIAIEAIAAGRRAALAIDEYLRGKTV